MKPSNPNRNIANGVTEGFCPNQIVRLPSQGLAEGDYCGLDVVFLRLLW